MLPAIQVRNRPADSSGAAQKTLFEGRLSVPSGLLTLVNAATGTAGHIFVMRWVPATAAALCQIRYVNLSWVMTTAFGTAQNMGWDLIVARPFGAVYTGGTAIDMGTTVANTGSTATQHGTSQFTANSCRIATTGDLTSGVGLTLDANSFNRQQKWQSVTLGSDTALGASANITLLDARDDGAQSVVRSPITLATGEGVVIRNTILMGATGVGNAIVTVEWEEVVL